jgi:thiol-disulfide isomerase/thioredoxin
MARPPLLIALLALAPVVGACAGDDSGSRVPVVPATNAAVAPLLPTNAAALPAFDAEKLQALLDQLRGTPVVVNIWGSWCAPCEREAPLFARAASAYGDRVQFIGVDIMDTRTSARRKMQEWGLTYPSVYDAAGDVKIELGLVGAPDTLFYAASGALVRKHIGEIDGPVLDEEIRGLLEGA